MQSKQDYIVHLIRAIYIWDIYNLFGFIYIVPYKISSYRAREKKKEVEDDEAQSEKQNTMKLKKALIKSSKHL